MSMLKNLKSLFVVEEEGAGTSAKPDKAAASEKIPATASSKSPAAAPVGVESTLPPGKANAQFTEVLLKAMEKANIDGFDYLEYKKSLQSLQKMNMLEETAFQSAFAMAQTMGASSAHLVQTAQHYLQVLSEEEKKFEAALVNQKESRIGAKQKEADQLRQAIAQKQKQIEQLNADIAQHQKQLGAIDGELQAASNSIERTKNDFLASYQNLVNQIQQDVDKMKAYLK